MNKAYAVKFFGTSANGTNFELSKMITKVMEQLVAAKYQTLEATEDSILGTNQNYHYYSKLPLQKDDLVLVKTSNSNEIKLCIVVEEITEDIRATREIIAKLDFGSFFEEQKKKARKERLLNLLKEETERISNTNTIIKEAEKAAKNNDKISELLAEYYKG